MTFDVKPSFTSGSMLVFTDDESGVGTCFVFDSNAESRAMLPYLLS
jgi:hypothetical protein